MGHREPEPRRRVVHDLRRLQPEQPRQPRRPRSSTTSVVVRSPFVTANVSASTVAQGDPVTIAGTAQGAPRRASRSGSSAPTTTAGRPRASTTTGPSATKSRAAPRRTWPTGQYFVVVQHPMTNGVFDVDEVVDGGVTRVYDTSGNFFVAAGPGRLQGSDGASALVDLINGPNIDDTYTETDLLGRGGLDPDRRPRRRRGRASSRSRARPTSRSGDRLQVSVTSSAFEPTNKSCGLRDFGGLWPDHGPGRQRRQQHLQLHGRHVAAPARHLSGGRGVARRRLHAVRDLPGDERGAAAASR